MRRPPFSWHLSVSIGQDTALRTTRLSLRGRLRDCSEMWTLWGRGLPSPAIKPAVWLIHWYRRSQMPTPAGDYPDKTLTPAHNLPQRPLMSCLHDRTTPSLPGTAAQPTEIHGAFSDCPPPHLFSYEARRKMTHICTAKLKIKCPRTMHLKKILW